MREERLTVMEDAMKRATCRGVGAQRRPAHPLSLQHCLPNGILPGDIFAYGNGAYGLWKGLLPYGAQKAVGSKKRLVTVAATGFAEALAERENGT